MSACRRRVAIFKKSKQPRIRSYINVKFVRLYHSNLFNRIRFVDLIDRLFPAYTVAKKIAMKLR